MDNPSNARADGAYDRALAAYQEKSYDVARRWVLEALAHNKQHAAARALLARLDAARQPAGPFQSTATGPEVVSTDPTVLISRASLPTSAEPIEPTVMIRRDDPRRPLTDTDTHVGPLSSRQIDSRSVAEPTVIAPPKQRTAPSRSAPSRPSSPSSPSGTTSSFSMGAALQSLGERLQGRGRPVQPASARGRTGGGSWTQNPQTRGALIAIAAVAVGALLVWGMYRTVRWIFPQGQVLTITPRPSGGTLVASGIECGTAGSKCSSAMTTGDVVELDVRPDKGYAFTGFTGDCAPRDGRIVMSQARTCGARFEAVTAPSPPATFLLTINKPEGGTIVAAPGILCGANGSSCSAEIPSGAPVTLRADAADGYTFDAFTGDCPGNGETTMTSAKTCGATFIKAKGVVNRDVDPPVVRQPSNPKPKPAVIDSAQKPPVPQTIVPPPNSNPSTSPQPPNPDPGNTTGDPGKPAPAAKTRDEHAKEEIQQLINEYCAALHTLKADAVLSLFNQNNQPANYKEQFKDYKSLQCTIGKEPPVYQLLDSSEKGGLAKLTFEMKQSIKTKFGGAPPDHETIVTMVVSRKDFQSRWRIDRVTHEDKPK